MKELSYRLIISRFSFISQEQVPTRMSLIVFMSGETRLLKLLDGTSLFFTPSPARDQSPSNSLASCFPGLLPAETAPLPSRSPAPSRNHPVHTIRAQRQRPRTSSVYRAPLAASSAAHHSQPFRFCIVGRVRRQNPHGLFPLLFENTAPPFGHSSGTRVC